MNRRRHRFRISCGSHQLNLSARPHVMGIINLTNDSFSDGGQFNSPQAAYLQAKKLVHAGVDILDLGAESTRPGAKPVIAKDEIKRLIPALKKIGKLSVPISVDTYKPEVAEAALNSGASIVNDVTGLKNPDMRQLVARKKAIVIIMHMRGNPQTMQKAPRYKDVVKEVSRELLIQARLAEKEGIRKNRIILDPGIGFGKTLEHNLNIIKGLSVFSKMDYPILMGPSKKAFIGQLLDGCLPSERGWGTAAAVALCIANGAQLIRVHDVKEMRMVATVAYAISQGKLVRR